MSYHEKVIEATNFAAKMIHEGVFAGKAVGMAVDKYNVDRDAIYKELGRRSALRRKKNGIKPKRPKQVCKWCEEKAIYKIEFPDPSVYKAKIYSCEKHRNNLEEELDLWLIDGTGEWYDTYGEIPYVKRLWATQRVKKKKQDELFDGAS